VRYRNTERERCLVLAVVNIAIFDVRHGADEPLRPIGEHPIPDGRRLGRCGSRARHDVVVSVNWRTGRIAQARGRSRSERSGRAGHYGWDIITKKANCALGGERRCSRRGWR
jgi:hypothetical protein